MALPRVRLLICLLPAKRSPGVRMDIQKNPKESDRRSMATTRLWQISCLVAISVGITGVGCASREGGGEARVERIAEEPSSTAATESVSPTEQAAAEAEPVAPAPQEPEPAAVAEPVAATPAETGVKSAADVPTSNTSSAVEVAEPPVTKPAVPVTKSLAALRRELAAGANPDATIAATDSIGRLRGRGRAALPELVGLTADADPRIRWHAARSIGLIGEDAISAVPTLLTLLQDADPIVATQAAAAIGHIREDDHRTDLPPDLSELYDDAVTQLVAMLVHSDPRVRRACLRALRQLDPDPEDVMPVVDAVFAGEDPAIIMPALHSIADMGGDAVPFLIERLKRPQGRYWASVALTEIGPAAAAATPALVEALAVSPPDEQLQQILAIAAIGEGAQAAGDALLKLYAEGVPPLRGPLLYALGQLKVAGADPLLAETVASESPSLAATAVWARANIQPENPELLADAVTRLVQQTESEQEFERAAAVSGLSDLAADLEPDQRRELAACFSRLLEDASDRVHHEAGAALVRLGGDGVNAVSERLNDAVTQRSALEIVAAIGPPAAPAVEAILLLLDSVDADLVTEAVLALAAIGPQAGVAVEPLMSLLAASGEGEEQAALRLAAIYGLGRIGRPAAAPAIESLALRSKSSDVMEATLATWAVLQIDPDNQERFAEAVPLLTGALESESQTVRLEAAVALGDLGGKAAAALPALELIAEDDPIATIRTAAQQSLRKIRGS